MAKEESEVQKSIKEKVDNLEASKVSTMNELENAPEDQKPALQEKVKEIDRKLRWYAGRSSKPATKAKGSKKASKKEDKPAESPTPAPATAVIES